MVLNVEIKNRVATYKAGSERPICGNTGDTVKFTFDAEWTAHQKKTARFIWGDKYHDVEFTGDTCEVPAITNTQAVLVGVYVGEAAAEEDMLSSTLTTIDYALSVRCAKVTASNGTGKNYTNEARGYAEEAKKYAEALENAAGLEWKPLQKHDLYYSYDYVDEENNYETVYVEVNRGYADPAPMLADPGVYLVKISYWGYEKIFMILVPSYLTQTDIYSTMLQGTDGTAEYLILRHFSDEHANVDIDELTGTDTYAFSELGDGEVYYAKLG